MSTIKIKIMIWAQINTSFKHILTVSSKEGPFQSKSHHHLYHGPKPSLVTAGLMSSLSHN